MKKRILLIITIALVGSLMFAGGASEFFSGMAGGMATGAGIGAGLGSIIPGIGTAIGAAIGAIFGGFGGAVAGGIEGMTKDSAKEEAEKNKALDAYNAALGRYNQLDSMQDQTALDIQQSEANISAFDEALMRLPGSMDLQRQQMELEGQAQYTQLMNNWQGQELVNAARGQSGGSAALVAQQQKAQVEMFAGKDLKFDLMGGMYANMMQEFDLDFASQMRELQMNRSNAQKALDIQNSNLADIQKELKKSQQTVADTRKRATDLGVKL